MRITRFQAEEAATKLCSGMKVKIKEINDEISERVTKLVEKNVSESVYEFFDEYPDYVRTISSISLRGCINGSYINLTRKVPFNQDVTNVVVAEDDETWFKVRELLRDQSVLSKKVKEYYNNTVDILYELRTTKRIQENFPEAMPYLVEEISNRKIDEIRKEFSIFKNED